jgi:hypothetical protein
MKLNIRSVAVVSAVLVLVVAGLVYTATERLGMAGKEAGEARAATLQSYRIAQALKSLANGYELAMNEYYSTVLEFQVYRQKAADHHAAIERELATLAKLGAGDANAVAELNRAFKEMESFRIALETALSAENKDWDGAREALFKLNVVSVRAIRQADILARIASERAVALDQSWLEHQARALPALHGAMGTALVAGVLLLVGAFRPRRMHPEACNASSFCLLGDGCACAGPRVSDKRHC